VALRAASKVPDSVEPRRGCVEDRNLVEVSFRLAAKHRMEPADQSSSFEVSYCILDLSLRHTNGFSEPCETDHAGVAPETMREKEELKIDGLSRKDRG